MLKINTGFNCSVIRHIIIDLLRIIRANNLCNAIIYGLKC